MVALTDGQVGTAAPSGVLPALNANVVLDVVFPKDANQIIVLCPSDSPADIWYTNDGSTPTVGGANCYYVPIGFQDSREPVLTDATGRNTPTIKLISSGAAKYRVMYG